MSSLNIILRGNSTKRRYPERVAVRLTIESLGESEDTVTNEAAETCMDLTGFLMPLCSGEVNEDNAMARSNTGAVSTFTARNIYLAPTQPDWFDCDPKHGVILNRQRIYYSIIVMTVIFSDFSVMKTFIEKMDDHSNAKLNNVSWLLTDDTKDELSAGLRREAVLDAVAKANQYAGAVAFEDVTPVHIREIESDVDSDPQRKRLIYRHSSEVDLIPEDIVLRCCVEVAFESSCDLESTDQSGDT
ncbi:hypothetical protein N7491_010561 [Penicillium cf. griseofulvum]|uniref:Uncharacterized protein n=1 Tax=Penicillium cf. griseofulvum TaxID=2972120 RepID=A0A9W9T606_9EURO|nr:hypothetical protein N7472_000891 [Penicillium cf. griseofulvum]KAJ5422116.1 hypothetical protein N7491_010561 [Penicillium cf. griseofulvum]KAJ5428304.1 hypothetical protein N7445_009758 [Penicillium cf. griseofulvum]